jgi:hypothetical protein
VAAANLDGALWTDVGVVGLDRPALQVLPPHREFAVTPQGAMAAGMAPDPSWFEAERAITFGGWRTVERTARPGYSYRVEGVTHLSFMDLPFLPFLPFLPLRPGAAAAAMLAATSIEPARMWRILSDLLDDPGTRYPEVTVGSP